MAGVDLMSEITSDFKWWRDSAWWGGRGGHSTYGHGAFVKEGPFGNPARMIEDLMGADPTPGYVMTGHSEVEVTASIWACAGWFDKEYKR